MAKVNFVKSARKPIYQRGKRVEYVSKKGKREGQTLSKIDRTLPADENDLVFIEVGESYYWWALYNGPKQFSKERPKPSQLTGSEFLSQVYSIRERIEEFEADDVESIESFRDEVVSELEGMRDECQEKLDNMPEQLQNAPSGEILQNRIDSLEEMISNLEGLSFEKIDEFEYDEDDDLPEEAQKDVWEFDKEEKINEYLGELQEITYDGE